MWFYVLQAHIMGFAHTSKSADLIQSIRFASAGETARFLRPNPIDPEIPDAHQSESRPPSFAQSQLSSQL